MTFKNAIHTPIYALLAAALASGAAHAADLPYGKAPPPAVYAPTRAFSWTGFYAGLNVGGGSSGDNAFNNFLGTSAGKIHGGFGGAQVGYNYQLTPQIVVGIENDFEGTGLTHHNDWNSPSVGLPVFGTGRARAGLSVMDQHLFLYGTAGLATGQLNDAGIKKIKMGWTAGGGAEYAITPKWSGKLEYLYMDFKHDALPDWNKPKFHTVRLGVNYHFDPF